MSQDLVAFLNARLDEDAELARRCDGDDGCGEWTAHGHTVDFCQVDLSGFHPTIALHVALHDPARVLREVKAKRRVLARHALSPATGDSELQRANRAHCQFDGEPWPCDDLLDLALTYADHPDYPTGLSQRSFRAAVVPIATTLAETRDGDNRVRDDDPGRYGPEAVRTDRLGVLIDQFDRAREMAQVRLTGLGDDEYLWEPVPGCWSIRPRDEAMTPRAYGPGEWVLDKGAPDIPAAEYAEIARQAASGMTIDKIAEDWSVTVARVREVLAHTGPPEPDKEPVTTIAWRLGHLHSCFAGTWDWTFGERREPELLVDFSPSAAVAVDRFSSMLDRWRDSVATLTEEQLDTVGLSQYPYGSDPDDPFIGVLWGANLELIHHLAEIALLRDLWQARFVPE